MENLPVNNWQVFSFNELKLNWNFIVILLTIIVILQKLKFNEHASAGQNY